MNITTSRRQTPQANAKRVRKLGCWWDLRYPSRSK